MLLSMSSDTPSEEETNPTVIEVKSIAVDIANKVIKLFDINRFRNIISAFIRKKYEGGVDQIEKQLEFNVQFGDQQRDLSLLEGYTFDNIQGMTEELQNKLRSELQRGLMGNESPQQLKKRIADIFSGNNPTRFRFEDRIEMIARTEGKRASNMAKFANAQRLNRPLWKYIKIVDDDRTTDVSRAMFAKYGSPETAIPIDKEFSVTVKMGKKTKTYHGQYPPFMPNDRDSVVITQNKPGGKT